MAARSFEAVIQIQGDYLRAAYGGAVAQIGKMGELAVITAKDAMAPVERLSIRSRAA